MKTNIYIPISKQEHIEDENMARICDYLERHAKNFRFIKKIGDLEVDGCLLKEDEDMLKLYDKNKHLLIHMPKKIFADNIVGIWGSVKNWE